MKKKDNLEIRINPENRICPKFDQDSIAIFPIAEPDKMGVRVQDDCAEEHIM